MRRAWAWGAAALLSLGGAAARAQSRAPDRWDQARDPGALRAEKMFNEATDKVEDASTTRNQVLRQQSAAEARSLLEQLGGSKSSDERVRYLYGRVLSMLGDDSGVIAALAPHLGLAFEHPLGVEAMFSLAVAYAKAERFRDELNVYDRLLESDDRPAMRVVLLGNRGESRAKVDDFTGSVEDFRKVIDIVPMKPVPRWGLAVTLDRLGDLSRALEEGGYAWDLDSGATSALDDSGVFYAPPYERWWYHGLRRLAGAQRSSAPAEKLAHLQAADRFYELYLAQAPSSDRWAPLASARRKMIEDRIKVLRKQLPKDKGRGRLAPED